MCNFSFQVFPSFDVLRWRVSRFGAENLRHFVFDFVPDSRRFRPFRRLRACPNRRRADEGVEGSAAGGTRLPRRRFRPYDESLRRKRGEPKALLQTLQRYSKPLSGLTGEFPA